MVRFELSNVSEISSVEMAKQFCEVLRLVLDKNAPPSLRKVRNHDLSRWFDTINANHSP